MTWVHVDDDLLAFALPAGRGPRCHQHSIDADDLTAMLNGFARACRDGAPWQDAAADVARLLIAPFATEIGDADGVVVVPFLVGHRLPFISCRFDGELLGARRTVSVPARHEHHPEPGRPARGRPGRGRAVHRRESDSDGLDTARRHAGGATLRWDSPRPRPAMITRPGDVCLIGPAATKANVVTEIARHRVVHFASHAHVTADAPQLSAVLLAGGDTLSVADLMGTGLPADLVVLSACDTGTGTLTEGDEVVGLTRGLFAAGARQAVVSLWPANDLATCLLMRRFYAGLAEATAAESLRRACQELAALDLDQQVDELMALQAELADQETPEPVLEKIERAAAMRRGSDASEAASIFTHPRVWAPFVHLGLP